MIGISLSMNAWREIFQRVFGNVTYQDNVTPEWLVNPATKRRLKLDKYYPDLGIAVRFVGLTAKGQGRQSDWEVLETEQRDETREELCRLNGVQLLLIEPDSEDVVKQMDALLDAISRASTNRPNGKVTALPGAQRTRLLQKAGAAASELRSRLAKAPQQAMSSLAEAWRDREINELPTPLPPREPSPRQKNFLLSVGQIVQHERFGQGEVVALAPEGEDQKVTIRFDAGQDRTFLASLVQEKLALATAGR